MYSVHIDKDIKFKSLADWFFPNKYDFSNEKVAYHVVKSVAGLSLTYLGYSVNFDFSRDCKSYAVPVNNDIFISMHKYDSSEDSLIGIIGVCLHEIGHCLLSKYKDGKPLKSWLDFFEQDQKIEMIVANLVEDMYINNYLISLDNELSWFVDFMCYNYYTCDHCELDFDNMALADKLNTLGLLLNPYLTVNGNGILIEIKKLLDGSKGKEFIEDRIVIAKKIVELLVGVENREELQKEITDADVYAVIDVVEKEHVNAKYKSSSPEFLVEKANIAADSFHKFFDGCFTKLSYISTGVNEVRENSELINHIDFSKWKELEKLSKAKTVRRKKCVVGNKGKLNRPSRLVTDGLAFSMINNSPQWIPPEIIILLDCSGSMGLSGLIEKSLANVFVMAKYLQHSCDVAIYGHTCYDSRNTDSDCDLFELKQFNRKIDEKIFHFLANNTLKLLADNTDSLAVYEASKLFTKRRNKKLLIVISDGAPESPVFPHNEQVYYLKEVVKNLKVDYLSVSLVEAVEKMNDDIYGIENNLKMHENPYVKIMNILLKGEK